ncbi:MAG: host attachment protein [Planctomycetota bacterium]|jgi:protein required for attachment to host cells
MKAKGTWLLVCDASRARIFGVDTRRKSIELLQEIDHPPGRARASEIVADKAGHVQQSGSGGRRAAMAPPTDPTDVEMRRFARRLGDLLEKGFDEHRYDRLFLVAPPRFLGMLREDLNASVARSVVATLDKNHAGLDVRALQERLRDFLSVAGTRG